MEVEYGEKNYQWNYYIYSGLQIQNLYYFVQWMVKFIYMMRMEILL